MKLARRPKHVEDACAFHMVGKNRLEPAGEQWLADGEVRQIRDPQALQREANARLDVVADH